MNSSNNLKSGQKALTLRVLILAIIIILIALVGLFIQKSSVSSVFKAGFKDYQRSAKLLKDVNSVHANLYKIKGMVAASQEKQEIAKLSEQQIAQIAEDVSLVKKALDSDLGAEQKKFYQAILDNMVEYEKSAVQVIRLAPMGTGTAYLSSANERMEAVTQLLGQLLAFESHVGEKGYSSANLAFYAAAALLIILLILCIILIPSFIKKMMTESVVEPLEETSTALREFAAGKFNRPLTWDEDDAIGQLVQSVNSLRSRMSAVPAPSQRPAHEPAPAQKPAAPEPVAPAADDKAKSLSDMIKKTPDADTLVTSSKKAIDRLQDI
ncbi:MAG: HAMP domain-containing protein [Deltaproteobacteria bacterium]|nr:HAMP domain-containing protein [Deltaproteobacteria bacterium]